GEVDDATVKDQLREVLRILETECEGRGYELIRVASGFRYQVRQDLSEWISRLWEEKPPRYSRALLETLSLIAYRQPVTRGDIEQVRGVSVSQSIMRTLLERNWIRVVGERDVPGKPAMYGTTREFLDYFNLKSLDQLPPLAEIRALIEPVFLDEDGEEVVEHGAAEMTGGSLDDTVDIDAADEDAADEDELEHTGADPTEASAAREAAEAEEDRTAEDSTAAEFEEDVELEITLAESGVECTGSDTTGHASTAGTSKDEEQDPKPERRRAQVVPLPTASR
ncbi:MAG: SMC-Scp complex subunit ScpB, partial [Pseudomonadales bacterium]|nr:SMC-Scp complex subunit ScpB [Pseudomonadales bacterium]